MQARWSPDGTKIVFLKDEKAHWQLWTMSPADPAKATLLAQPEISGIVDWTPDGKTIIAFDSQRLLWVGLDGKQQRSLPLDQIYGKQFQWMGSDHLRFDPKNADRLSVSAYYMETIKGAVMDEMDLTATVFLYDTKAKTRKVILDTKTFGHDGEWSPDGQWLYFTRMEKPRVYAVWRVHPDGTGLEKVVAGEQAVVAP